MLPLEIIQAKLGCAVCEATGPTGAVGLQMLVCGSVSGVVLFKMAAEDVTGKLLGRGRDSGHGSGNARHSQTAKGGIGPRIQPGLAILSAVQLATSEFIRHSFPSLNLIAVPAVAIAKLLLLLQVLPFLILLGLDVFISKRYSPKAAMRYRATIFAVAAVLVLRQLELHLDPTSNFATNLRLTSPGVYAFVALTMVLLAIWTVIRFYSGVITFLAYFSPAAVVLSILITQATSPQNQFYEGYNFSEAPSHAPDKPPVYVIVFDELSYEALLDSTGQIQADLYPNFARLGRESLHLTNATSNYYRTWLALPEITDSVLLLADRYEVRLYEQTHRVEALYAPGCGHAYTCRGLRYMMERDDGDVVAYLAMRTTYDAWPDWLEGIGKAPLHAAVKQIGSPPPPSDPLGFHETSVALLEQYLDDIGSESANGRVYFLHTMLPHYPFVYDQNGGFEMDDHILFPRLPTPTLSEDDYAAVWEHYRDQIAYADTFLGRFIDRLEQAGLYDDAVIMVTSDHGLRPLSPSNGQPIEVDSLPTHIPMFIRAPGLTPRLSDIDYQHVDLGPTLFDLVGYQYVEPAVDSTPTKVAHVSALAAQRPDRVKEFYIDYFNERYWRYVKAPGADGWVLDETVESPLGDRTPLSGR